MKVSVYIATSLDGFIVRANGDIDWLSGGDSAEGSEDYGYKAADATVQVLRTKYYAVSTDRLIELMDEAGYTGVRRLDGRFFQPLIVGTKTE